MKRILVTGARGMLGFMLTAELGDLCLGVDLPEADITLASSILPFIKKYNPDVIVNTAAITDVDSCERNPRLADAVHNRGVRILSETGVRLITISTDQVFYDGRGIPLTEKSPVMPVNEYSASKLKGEKAALENPANCVVRTSWLNGSGGMISRMAKRLDNGGTVTAVADQTSCITLTEHLAQALLLMVFDESRRGLYHCVNPGPVTPFYLACLLRRETGRGRVVPVEWADLSLPAKRPVWSALESEREITMPPFEEAMKICMKKIL
ncbi:MAG: NAD(P)-dependent oxidoreductase [Candidatus Neomarinimicrobiota bacterium]